MKNFLITGDWHITDKCPANRIDNYEETLFQKLEFIFKTAEENNCEIFQPGDFFDSPDPSYHLFTRVVDLLNRYPNIRVFTIWGQHDLRYRNPENTALKALNSCCSNLFIVQNDLHLSKENISIYGASYNKDIPTIKEKNLSILLIHKMIIKEKLWEQQTDYAEGNAFLKDNKFDLIVSGDNHKGFVMSYKNRFLINCGSLMRSNTTQLEHQPFIVLIKNGILTNINIPIEDSEKVFAVDRILKEKEKNEKLDSFISGLSEQKTMGLDFESNLNTYMKENNIDEDIKKIIKEMANG